MAVKIKSIYLVLLYLFFSSVFIYSCGESSTSSSTTEIDAPMSLSSMIASDKAIILKTKIMVLDTSDSKTERLSFNVPIAGYAVLNIVNAAKANSNIIERVNSVDVSLNKSEIVTDKIFNRNTNSLDIAVKLQKGLNEIKIKIKGDIGKRIALRIDAPADKIYLQPLLNSILVNKQALQARATVTGLGLPVQHSAVVFSLIDFEQKQQQTVSTSNAGIALSDLTLKTDNVMRGKLQANLTGTNLVDSIPLSLITNRTMTVNQSVDQLILKSGTVNNNLYFSIQLNEVLNNSVLLKVEHSVMPITNSPVDGLNFNTDFPIDGKIINTSKTLATSPDITAISVGSYKLNTKITLTHKLNNQLLETFNSTVLIEVMSQNTVAKSTLSKPFASPSGLAPSSNAQTVIFGTTYVNHGIKPKALFLDEVTQTGARLNKSIALLHDDGIEPDVKGNDGIYTGAYKILSLTETEKFFRISSVQQMRDDFDDDDDDERHNDSSDKDEHEEEKDEHDDVSDKDDDETEDSDEHDNKRDIYITSSITNFPITTLKIGVSGLIRPILINDPNSKDKLFANEVLIGARQITMPSRIKTIISEIKLSSGYEILISGYLPSLNAYLISFNGDNSIEAINNMLQLLTNYKEVKYAEPNYEIQPAAASQWFLHALKIPSFRTNYQDFNVPIGRFPLYGTAAITVAVIDSGINCDNPDLNARCVALPSSFVADPQCNQIYINGKVPSEHGTRVAALIAAQSGVSNIINGIVEGVSWNSTILPMHSGTSGIAGIAAAIDCVRKSGAVITNISYESNTHPTLEDAVCNLICSNKLIIAASGNRACLAANNRYPASFDNGTSCNCSGTTVMAGDRILKVGGTDSVNQIGSECSSPSIQKKSQTAEIYSPGWGLPASDIAINLNYGTSWSAALVTGCVAIRAALLVSGDIPVVWNASNIETQIRNSTNGAPALLDCGMAIAGDIDHDNDGLTDALEFELGTDPNDSDSDSDGLLDGQEINDTSTNPLLADSNLDGYCDGSISVAGTCVTIDPDFSCPIIELIGATVDVAAASGIFGRESVQASAINSSGQIVGNASFEPGIGYLWEPGSTAIKVADDLIVDPAGFTNAADLNDSGVVVGFYRNLTTGTEGGFRWTRTSGSQLIGTLGGVNSNPRGINNSGQIVGSSRLDTPQEIAFRVESSDLLNLTPLLPLPDYATELASANAINDLGVAVGNSQDKISSKVTRWAMDGIAAEININDSNIARANDINNEGLIVGNYYDEASGNTIAYIWNPETRIATDLPSLGGSISRATAINDCGIVVGQSEVASGQRHAFYWSAATNIIVDLDTLDPGIPGVNTILVNAIDVNKRSEVVVLRELPDAATVVLSNVLRFKPGSVIEP